MHGPRCKCSQADMGCTALYMSPGSIRVTVVYSPDFSMQVLRMYCISANDGNQFHETLSVSFFVARCISIGMHSRASGSQDI